MTEKRFWLLWFALAILVIAGGIVGLGLNRRWADGSHAGLLTDLPKSPAGWIVEDMPVANSAEMKKAVAEMLNYDQAVYREYRKGERSLTVYAAYWRPYKCSPRLVSIHTPDVCWTGSGWAMVKENYAYPVMLDRGAAWPAQERLFEANGTRIHVLYWHLLGGRLSGYAEGPNSASRSFFKNFWHDLHYGSGEQFFIRISSPQPWDTWKDDLLFRQIVNAFAPVLMARERS